MPVVANEIESRRINGIALAECHIANMKKKVMLGVIAAMVVSMSATVFAGPSIGQIIPEEPQIVSTNVPEGAKLVVSTIDVTDEKTLDNYTSNETVKTLLKTVN